MNQKLLYSFLIAGVCIIHAADRETNQKNEEAVQRLTQHLETLQTMYRQLESIEAEIDTYQLENAPARFDMCTTLSAGRETVDIMLQSTQGFLSNAKEYLGGFINFLLSLPSSIMCNKPEPMDHCCGQPA